MRFKIEKIIKDGDLYSASAKSLDSPMHASIFELPAKVKVGDIVNASPIERGGGCSLFYNFKSFDKD